MSARLFSLAGDGTLKEIIAIKQPPLMFSVEKIIKRLRSQIRLLITKNSIGRDIRVYEDDTFIVSYPKSGNTWVRLMLSDLITTSYAPDFESRLSPIPNIYEQKSKLLEKYPRPRILKSHEYFNPQYNRVVYIVRDPRDVLVSAYHYMIKRRTITELYPISKFVEACVSKQYFGQYGSWSENVGSWLGAKQLSPNFLLLRYEDILADPTGELRRIVTFLNIHASNDDIEKAVRKNSFENMQDMEKQYGHSWRETSTTRMDKLFFRNGKAGSWRKELMPDSIRLIEKNWADTMSRLGYKVSLPAEQANHFQTDQ